jgi:LacI family transcriptional regulator
MQRRVQSRVTLRDVARAAGVSVPTVSRVLHPRPGGRPAASIANADRIREIARKLNYVPDIAASSLRTGVNRDLAVIVPRLSDLVLATIYEGIQERAGESGYTTFVANSRDEADLRRELTANAIDRRVAGLIFGDATISPAFLNSLAGNGTPFVTVSRRSGAHPGAWLDDRLGGALVADHLYALGHTEVAVIGGTNFSSTGVDRATGFLERMAEHGVEVGPERHIVSGFDAAAGEKAMSALLGSGSAPTAVFAVNDFTAIGAMGAARSRGLVIGDDVAIAGYNDTSLAAYLPVPLTTVRSPMHKMGRAADLMIRTIDGAEAESVTFEPTLVERASTLGSAAST